MSEVRSKVEFYALWRAGLLGNKPRVWASLAELDASGYAGVVNIRTVGAAGSKTEYGVARNMVAARTAAWAGTPTYNEPAPDDVLLIQGEVARTAEGLYLRYSDVLGLRMNEAMRDSRTRDVRGLVAKMTLDFYLSPCSRDDVDELLDMYPDAVIEFSTYGRHIGDQPHRNTFIWEVRNY